MRAAGELHGRLGMAAGWPSIGWLCALLAALTAYVRVFGAAVGLTQKFTGPMAKQHRMAVATIAVVMWSIPTSWWLPYAPLQIALVVIAVGSLLTCCFRAHAIAHEINTKKLP